MIPPVDPLSFILSLVQISASQEMNRFNSLVREDIARNTVLTTQLNQEHQLKMLKLQEQYKQQDKWLDFKLKKGLIHEQAAVQAHSEKMRQAEEFYKMGDYVEEKLRNKPAPFIIVSTNPHQRHNPFKNEVFSIAPLNRITNTIRQLNGIYEDRKLLTITDTNEFFISESDVAGFYHRELNCPCIIIYANFTGESLAISAYIAGMLDAQRENISFEKGFIDHSPKRELLWDISYSKINAIIEHYKKEGNPYMWQEYLSKITNMVVILWIQRYLDEHFKYNPLHIYESQTMKFIEAERQILSKELPNELKKLEERNIIIRDFQKKLWKTEGTHFRKVSDLYINGDFDYKDFTFNDSGENFKISTFNIPPELKDNFKSGVLAIKDLDNNKIALINLNGDLITQFDYEEKAEILNDLIRLKKNGKWGVVNTKGKLIIDFKYEDLRLSFNDCIRFKSKRYWGLMDKSEKVIIEPEFEDLVLVNSNILYVCKNDNDWRILYLNPDGNCETIAEGCKYVIGLGEYLNYRQGDWSHLFNIKTHITIGLFQGEYLSGLSWENGYLVHDGEKSIDVLLMPGYDDTLQIKQLCLGTGIKDLIIHNQHAGMISEYDSEITNEFNCYYDFNNSEYKYYRIKVELYNKFERFWNENHVKLALPFFNEMAAFLNQNDFWGVFSKNFDIIFEPTFVSVGQYNNKLINVKYQNDFWGYLDKNGNRIFPPIFIESEMFNDNRALVQLNGFNENEWAIIDNEGNILTRNVE